MSQTTTSYVLDLTAAIAQLRDQLRGELLAELGAHREHECWMRGRSLWREVSGSAETFKGDANIAAVSDAAEAPLP